MLLNFCESRAITTVFNVHIFVDVSGFISGKGEVVVLHQPSCTRDRICKTKKLREIFSWLLKIAEEWEVQPWINEIFAMAEVLQFPNSCKVCHCLSYSSHLSTNFVSESIPTTLHGLHCAVLAFFLHWYKYPSLRFLHSVYQGNSGASRIFVLPPLPTGVIFFLAFPLSTCSHLWFHTHLPTASP